MFAGARQGRLPKSAACTGKIVRAHKCFPKEKMSLAAPLQSFSPVGCDLALLSAKTPVQSCPGQYVWRHMGRLGFKNQQHAQKKSRGHTNHSTKRADPWQHPCGVSAPRLRFGLTVGKNAACTPVSVRNSQVCILPSSVLSQGDRSPPASRPPCPLRVAPSQRATLESNAAHVSAGEETEVSEVA
jgi:hypothetical protein